MSNKLTLVTRRGVPFYFYQHEPTKLLKTMAAMDHSPFTCVEDKGPNFCRMFRLYRDWCDHVSDYA